MSQPLEFVIGESEDQLRLDQALATLVPTVSRMRLREALDLGQVLVNGEAQAAGWKVAAGDHVTITADLTGATAMTPEAIPLSILFEDEQLIVVQKPAGMVVHPAGRHRGGTLANALAHHFNVAGAAEPPIRPGIVHRLDRATSGVMVVAKTQRALSRLTVQFQEKRVRKLYLALVHGEPEGDEGEWDSPIGSDPEATPRWGIRESGRPAVSRYRVRERGFAHPANEFAATEAQSRPSPTETAGLTLLELEPVTGRTNQLRLHAAHFGYPIAGDELFGRGLLPGLERLFLHAHRLEVRHPATNEAMAFESPLPVELSVFLETLRSQEG